MKIAACLAAGWLLLIAASCGGGGGGGGGGVGGGPPPTLNMTTTTLPDGVVGDFYGQSLNVTGGTGAKTFAISAGALPAGLSLNAANGFITGVLAGPAGTANFTVSVTDSGSPAQTDAQAFNFEVAEPLQLTLGVAPQATIGAPFNHVVTASGGIPPYTFSSSVAIPLPSGLSISAAGVISGSPLPDAITRISTIEVADQASPPQVRGDNLPFKVTLEVATSAMPDAVGGIEYHEVLLAQGGLPFYNWQITGGSLPPGISQGSLPGHLTGTPNAACSPTTSTFDVQVTDSDSPMQTATRQGIALIVIKGPLTVPAAALPVARVGVAYSAFIRPSLGVLPYTYAVTTGMLPNQLTLNAATGEITGTPDTDGIVSFTVEVTDACGTIASRLLNMVVGAAPVGRNDSIATATAIGNGQFLASISPSGHPNTVFAPDQDYYSITTFAASTITVDLTGLTGEIDTVMEIVDANGNRLNSCVPPEFTSTCVNDDEFPGASLDSLLVISVNAPTTFYVRVVEWRFDGRPDLQYTINVSGLN